VAPATPIEIENRPGLSAIAYRVGTYASFRQAMLEAIAGTPELASLRTRLSDDHAITLLELWATIADVLSFYQERGANEAFLRTARFRDSVLRMARLIDYHLGPGAAATTMLAFTVEKDSTVRIPVGLRVQSVPGQDEKPQKFETLETITADARLNRLRVVPAPIAVNPLAKGTTRALLVPDESALAVANGLAPEDRFLIFRSGTSDPIEELEIEEVRVEHDRIVLAWSGPIQGTSWDVTAQAFKLGRRFRIFGYNAPPQHMRAIPDDQVAGGIRWELKTTVHMYSTAPVADLVLDGRYEELAVGSRLLVSVQDPPNPTAHTLVTVSALGEAQPVVGPVSDRVTKVTVFPKVQLAPAPQVRIHELTGPPIRFWGHTYPEVVATATVYLPGRKLNGQKLEVGRAIAKNAYQPGTEIDLEEIDLGRRVLLQDAQGHAIAATIDAVSMMDVPGADGTEPETYLKIDLDSDQEASLDARSAVLLGNVARASHGETVKEEIMGGGDASAIFQRLTLKKKPLTFVPSAGPGGLASTLRVLVDRVLWNDVPSLYEQAPTAQVHTTRIADDGTVTVGFGDGVTGARTFSGRANIVATYRHGTGVAGRVRGDSLTTLLDRPIGLRSVTNPRPADGGADPETLDEARENAPSTVRTFGRAVSLVDFEDLVTAPGEVAKAKATWVWTGETRAVHLTVAGQGAATFSPDALSRIHASLNAQRDPNHMLFIDNFVRVPLMIAATLHVSATRVAADVERAARTAIVEALSFDHLRFGQAVHLSDLYRVLQEVPGVVWAKIDVVHFKDQSAANLAARGADGNPVQEHLRIYPARGRGPQRGSRVGVAVVPGPPDVVMPAEQAWIESPTHDVTLVTSGGLPL
jgi:hypothetical protein